MPLPCDTLIRCGVLLTQDEDRTVLEDAGLAIAQGEVRAAGPWESVAGAHSPAQTLDLSRCLVLPGLINTHTHAAMALLRGLADDLPLMQWLTEHVWPMEGRLSPELILTGAMLACADMLASGTTCFVDMYVCQDRLAPVLRRIGVRAVLGEGIFDFPTASYAGARQGLDKAEALCQALRGGGLVTACVAPHAAYTNPPEILQESYALAERFGLPWTIHLAETKEETAASLERTGLRPAPFLHSLGLLGPRSLLAHCVDLDPADIRLLAENRCAVSHQPVSNMKLASGVAPVPALLRAGVPVCLGTDGAASNNSLNMFGEMKACALLHKVIGLDPTLLPAQATLDLATREAAKVLGQPRLGRLAPGSAADLAALDLDLPSLAPLFHPASQAVYAATGQEVRLTMVGGRVLYRDGEFPTLDYPGLLAQVRDAARWARGLARAGKTP